MCLRAGIHKNGMTVFSAHQMGTARMGASAKSSVVDPRGECWHVANLYVADASLFPTSTGAHAAFHAARLDSSSWLNRSVAPLLLLHMSYARHDTAWKLHSVVPLPELSHKLVFLTCWSSLVHGEQQIHASSA